jgi:hypothetical protein
MEHIDLLEDIPLNELLISALRKAGGKCEPAELFCAQNQSIISSNIFKS